MVILIIWISFILLEQKIDQKINLNLMKKVHKNKDFCGIAMPSEKNNILEFNRKTEV